MFRFSAVKILTGYIKKPQTQQKQKTPNKQKTPEKSGVQFEEEKKGIS